MARALCRLAPESLQLEIIDIGQLPLYNQDYDDEGHPPAPYTAFREQVKSFDAVLLSPRSTTAPFQLLLKTR